MIHTYRLISLILYPLLVLIIYLRKVFNKEDKVRFKEKLFYSSFLNNFNNSRKLIWFHAASIGEVQSIIPIINRLDKETKKFNFLITTITLTSGKFIKEEFKSKNNITHRYLPLDLNSSFINFPDDTVIVVIKKLYLLVFLSILLIIGIIL